MLHWGDEWDHFVGKRPCHIYCKQRTALWKVKSVWLSAPWKSIIVRLLSHVASPSIQPTLKELGCEPTLMKLLYYRLSLGLEYASISPLCFLVSNAGKFRFEALFSASLNSTVWVDVSAIWQSAVLHHTSPHFLPNLILFSHPTGRQHFCIYLFWPVSKTGILLLQTLLNSIWATFLTRSACVFASR